MYDVTLSKEQIQYLWGLIREDMECFSENDSVMNMAYSCVDALMNSRVILNRFGLKNKCVEV